MTKRKPNPEMLDEENPEITDEWFKTARPAKDVLASIVGSAAAQDMLKPKRGRPLSKHPKEHVNIRLDADIVGSFKKSGAGWQTKINHALREWLQAHPTLQ